MRSVGRKELRQCGQRHGEQGVRGASGQQERGRSGNGAGEVERVTVLYELGASKKVLREHGAEE